VDFLTTLITGAVAGAIITGVFNMYSKHTEYKNSYLKMILEKRIEAYERINSVITLLKMSVVDNGKAYHMIFSSDKDAFYNDYSVVTKAFMYELWMSDNAKNNLLKLQQEIVRCFVLHNNGMTLIDVGKSEYKIIANLRDNLEKDLVIDLQNLYKIEDFLSNKTVTTEFVERNIADRPKEEK
jgi:hypothetical protein